MNEGWIEYDGSEATKPPKGKRVVVYFRDKTLAQGPVEGWDWSITGEGGDILAWGYAYVEPEPEMPEVEYLVINSNGWLVSATAAEIEGSKSIRYRRCVEMTPKIDDMGDARCSLCGAYLVFRDRFCPSCGAEVKR